jgi:hypothetical protein
VLISLAYKINGADVPKPPGVGEQQVFSMAVVFSQEKNEGWLRHAEMLGRVFGSCRRPVKELAEARATSAVMTRPASTLK